ncbi:MAG: PF20097 family protein [Candidatus Thermoplasmatota archaeon]|nr:PF20097 family protein [Candidatus Thermoplasmatota archaeon]
MTYKPVGFFAIGIHVAEQSPLTGKCPHCGGEMESGFLGSESFVSGMKWFKEKTILDVGGEKIKEPGMSGMVYLDGFICRKCNTIVVTY